MNQNDQRFLGRFELEALQSVIESSVSGVNYGLEIHKALEKRSGRQRTRGPTYAVLERLVGKGLLRKEEREIGLRGRPRVYYFVTGAGYTAMNQHYLLLGNLGEAHP